jgi:hypothetical protein
MLEMVTKPTRNAHNFEENEQVHVTEYNNFNENIKLNADEAVTIIQSTGEANESNNNLEVVQNVEINFVDFLPTRSDFDFQDVQTQHVPLLNDIIIELPCQVNYPEGQEQSQIYPIESTMSEISDGSEINKNLVPYSDTDSISSSDGYPKKSKKRKKRFQVQESTWCSEKNKKLRESGKRYCGRTKQDGKWCYDKPKEPRVMKPRCKCKSKQRGIMKCSLINEHERQRIFKSFWQMSWGEKKVVINNQVKSVPTKRHRNRKQENETKRGQSLEYFLRVQEECLRVCRTMFINTLVIGRWTILHWKSSFGTRTPSILRQSTSGMEPFKDRHECLFQFLDTLPVMESHYCRSTSQKKYLLAEWQSRQSVYEFYVKDWCKAKKQEPLSIASFSKAFDEKNFALFRPKKDECEKCVSYRMGQVLEDEFNRHVQRKMEAREEKEKDKKERKYVFTADLQAVLMAPKSKVSTLYYKTKLQVHNLCFYNLVNSNAYCFVWNECEGGLGAEEFSSIWMYFIEQKILLNMPADTDERSTIIMYTDGCGYQNRNALMANVLLNVAVAHNIVIEQKYLEPGHTQMEVDSVHATIERNLKDKIINLPADYVPICQKARKKPAPYQVKYLTHDFFLNFDPIQRYKTIRPGRGKGDLKVTDIRALRYTPEGEIYYKASFVDEWKRIPQRKNTKIKTHSWEQLKQLYTERRKITAKKYEDLQAIKKTLPVDYHKFYDDLPHE